MSGFDGLSDVFRLAATVLALGPGEPPEACLALAWVACNRSQAVRPTKDTEQAFGDGTLAGACRSLAGDIVKEAGVGGEQVASEASGDHLRAMAIACQVLAGDLPDPTDGAVLLHRHDEQPGWAAGRQPCALLGSHFFYRLDEH